MPAITQKQRDALGARNVVYIDTEAKLDTSEAGGWTPRMGVSMLGLFDYRRWRTLGGLRFATVPGDTLDVLSRRPAVWAGHNLIGYDLAVMAWAGYLDPLFTPEQKKAFTDAVEAGKTNSDLCPRVRAMLSRREIEIIDTMEIGRDMLNFRPKLDGYLGPVGMSKLDSGADAPGMARRGEWGRLTTYLAGDVCGGTTVLEMFLGRDELEYAGRQGVVSTPVGYSWKRRREELLTMPSVVQQEMFDG